METKLTQKKVKFEWGDKQEAAFQLLKQKLCSAPILALPEGSEDFIAYCDASKKGLGADILRSKRVNIEANVHGRVASDYDCDIRYHLGKANVVADALSRKEREPPLRVLAWTRPNTKASGLLVTTQETRMEVGYTSPGFVTKLPKTGSSYDTIWVTLTDTLESSIFTTNERDRTGRKVGRELNVEKKSNPIGPKIDGTPREDLITYVERKTNSGRNIHTVSSTKTTPSSSAAF
ncbi:reverse transcriptase domain-containing protein [Tanacetum coccineum]